MGAISPQLGPWRPAHRASQPQGKASLLRPAGGSAARAGEEPEFKPVPDGFQLCDGADHGSLSGHGRACRGEQVPEEPSAPSPPARLHRSPSGALSTVNQSLKRAECSFLSSSSSGRSRMSFSVCGGQVRGQEGGGGDCPGDTHRPMARRRPPMGTRWHSSRRARGTARQTPRHTPPPLAQGGPAAVETLRAGVAAGGFERCGEMRGTGGAESGEQHCRGSTERPDRGETGRKGQPPGRDGP